MWNTFEMRWFYPGNLPPMVQDWFTQACLGKPSSPAEKRTDFYLVIPKVENLGVKLRHGKIEIKRRNKPLEKIELKQGWIGQAEHWTKETLNHQQLQTLLKEYQIQNPGWIRVTKERQQKTFGDCTTEITQLEINQQSWWTLAVEQVIKSIENERNWRNLVCQILQNYPDLDSSNSSIGISCGYPEWLFKLQNDDVKL